MSSSVNTSIEGTNNYSVDMLKKAAFHHEITHINIALQHYPVTDEDRKVLDIVIKYLNLRIDSINQLYK